MNKADYENAHEPLYQKLKEENAAGYITEGIKSRSDWFGSSLKDKQKLLVLGCGNGLLAIEVAKKGFCVAGIDISTTAIKWANELNNPNFPVQFKIGNVLQLPYNDNEFDGIIDDYCFHCIIGEDRNSFLREAHRVLSPNGILASITMCGEPAATHSAGVRYDSESRTYLNTRGQPFRYLGMPEHILSEVKNAGFAIGRSDIELRKNSNSWDALHFTATK